MAIVAASRHWRMTQQEEGTRWRYSEGKAVKYKIWRMHCPASQTSVLVLEPQNYAPAFWLKLRVRFRSLIGTRQLPQQFNMIKDTVAKTDGQKMGNLFVRTIWPRVFKKVN